MTIRSGKAFVFGDNIDTDILAPGHLMRLPARELASHCLEAVSPDFSTSVRPGDFVVAGRNFGMGSSREQAAVSLKLLGISAVIAESFARIFYRNAINIGLPVLTCSSTDLIASGDLLKVEIAKGQISNQTKGNILQVKPVPQHLMSILNDGGLVPHLKKRLSSQEMQP